jgi:predicted component of type VI protein secretion system
MALRFSIVGGDVADSGNRRRWTFGVNGGRIGRASDNDWVLIDPERFVSAHHVEVEHRTGEWWVCDTSTNGTFINGSARPLGRGGKHRIADGDRVRIGSLELLAEISGGNDFLPDEEDLDLSETALESSFTVKSLLSNEPRAGKVHAADAYGQPLPPRAPAKSAGPAAKSPAPRPVRQEPAAGPARGQMAAERDLWPGLVAFCQGAGIDPAAIPAAGRPDVLREAGQAMRETMLGLMELARSRAEFTREVGISGSKHSRDATSPLMQVRAVEDALIQILAAQGPDAGRAVNEVRTQFAKARHHQQSMLVAVREALTTLLQGLDPDELEQQFGGTTRGPAGAEVQARYWQLYREMFRSLAAPGETGLPPTFQEEFARSYQALSAVGLRAAIAKMEDSN